MTDAQNISYSRTEGDQPTPEPSPSADRRETAELMHVTPGLEECDIHRCDRDGEPLEVVDGDTEDVRREDVRSSDHEKRISKNCETLVEVIKHSTDPFVRALALAALAKFGDDPEVALS